MSIEFVFFLALLAACAAQPAVYPMFPTNYGTNALYYLYHGITDPLAGGAVCTSTDLVYTQNGVVDQTISLGGYMNITSPSNTNFFGGGGIPARFVNVTVVVYINAATAAALPNSVYPNLLVQVAYQLYPPATDVCDARAALQINCTLFAVSVISATASTCARACPTDKSLGAFCGTGYYNCDPLPQGPLKSTYVVRFYVGPPPALATSQPFLGKIYSNVTPAYEVVRMNYIVGGQYPNQCSPSASVSKSESHSKSHRSESKSHHSHSQSRSPSYSAPVYDKGPVNLVINGGCDSPAFAVCGAVAACGTNTWALPASSLSSCGTYCSGGVATAGSFSGWLNQYSTTGFGCVYNNLTVSPTFGLQAIGYPYQGTGFISINAGKTTSGADTISQQININFPAAVISAGLAFAYVSAMAAVANGTQMTCNFYFMPPATQHVLISVSSSAGSLPASITWVPYTFSGTIPSATTYVLMQFSATNPSSSVHGLFGQIDSVTLYAYTSACIGLPPLPVGQNYTAGCNAVYTTKGSACLLHCLPAYVSTGGNFSAVCNKTWSSASMISNNWVLGTGSCVHSNSASHSDSHSKSHASDSKSHRSHSHSKSHASDSKSRRSHSHSKSHASDSKSHRSHSHSKSHASDSKSRRSHSHSKSHASDSKSHRSNSASHRSHSHHSESPVYPHIAQAPTNSSFCTSYTAPYGASHGASVVATCPPFFEVCHVNFAFFGVMNGTCNTTLMATNPTCVWNLTAAALACIGQQSCSVPWPGTVSGVPAGANTCMLANSTIATMILAGGCCSTLPQTSSASDSHSKSHESKSKSHDSHSHSKSHDSHSRSKSHDSHSHSKSHDSHSHSKSHGSHSHSKSHGSHSHSTSHGSHSHSKSHDSHSHSKSHDSHSHSKSHGSHSHSTSHDSHSHSRSRDSDSRSTSHKSRSHSKSHASHSHSKSHGSHSHSKSHASYSHSESHASRSQSKSHGSHSHSKSHVSYSHSESHASRSQSKSHDSHSHSKSHDSHSHSTSHKSHSGSKSHASESHSRSRGSQSHSASRGSPSRSKSHASHSQSGSHGSDSRSQSHGSHSRSRQSHSLSTSRVSISHDLPSASPSRRSHSASPSASVSANPVFLEHFVTMGVDMDACFSVTALKTGGINATMACPPFSVFQATDFAAVGIAATPTRCAPDVDLVINDCWFNITAFMAARCDGLAACTFASATDLAASNFSLHACASYTYAPTITFDFYARCVSTVVVEVANPVFVGSGGGTAAVATAATATCPAQLRVAPADPYATSQIALVVALPGQWGLHTVLVHVVSYLSDARRALAGLPGVAVQLQFSAEGLPFALANLPGTVATLPVEPALRFAGQCPDLAAAEAPRAPTDDAYIVFNDIVDAPPNAIQFVFYNVLPGEFFYVSSIVVVDSNGTTVTFFPPEGTDLAPYVVSCAACAARYVASDVLID